MTVPDCCPARAGRRLEPWPLGRVDSPLCYRQAAVLRKPARRRRQCLMEASAIERPGEDALYSVLCSASWSVVRRSPPAPPDHRRPANRRPHLLALCTPVSGTFTTGRDLCGERRDLRHVRAVSSVEGWFPLRALRR